MKSLILPLLLFASSIAACSSEEAPPAAATPDRTPLTTTSEQPPAPAAAAAPFAPLTSRSRAGGAAGGSPIVAPGATFTLPDDWISEPPSSNMRLAQARIPGAAGEGQLTVFYFGAGGGGGLESNLSRWIGQVQIDSGTQPHRASFDSGGFRITWIEVQGTIKPSTMGPGPSEPQPGSRRGSEAAHGLPVMGLRGLPAVPRVVGLHGDERPQGAQERAFGLIPEDLVERVPCLLDLAHGDAHERDPLYGGGRIPGRRRPVHRY